MREGGKILASVLSLVVKETKPGVATIELDQLAEKLIREAGGEPSFKNYKTADDKIPYPASLCVSINDEIVHGIPSARKIKDGDIVSLDVVLVYNGYYSDMAITQGIGGISSELQKLIDVTKESLSKGLDKAKQGNKAYKIIVCVKSFSSNVQGIC